MADRKFKAGPDSAKVASSLRTGIAKGCFPIGEFLPCTRDLGKKHDVSSETVRRAMKILEAEGLIRAEPRQGFLVVRRPGKKTSVLAYVLTPDKPGTWEGFAGQILAVFQQVVACHGSSLLAIAADTADPAPILDHIRETGATGVILNTRTPEIFELVASLGLPTVTAEVWDTSHRFDAVVQDSFGGALQAADHLAWLGHKRIAWLGPTTGSAQAVERWGGAVAGLRRHGLAIPPEWIVDGDRWTDPSALRALLDRPDRPTAIISLWSGIAIGAARTAAGLGLRLGRDLDVVGWTTEEHRAEYEAAFPESQVPPTVTWRVEELAQAAMARLAECAAKPELLKVRISIPTRLHVPKN